MIVGVPKEIKVHEYRVGMVPAGVQALVKAGCKVIIEKGAGTGSGIPDSHYEAVGAEIVPSAKDVWSNSDMIIKVKEPVGPELDMFREHQIIYTYFHLAVAPELAKKLVGKKVAAVAYETIQLPDGSLPLLKPMSEVAGRMASQIGATYLQKNRGGKGVLLGGVPGVRRGRVTVIGAGTVGLNATKMAVGLGADVTVLDINPNRLEYFDDIFGSRVTTLMSNPLTIEGVVKNTDLLIGAVLIPGAKAPHLVSRETVESMEPGSVIVDVAVDQGGCVETVHPTTYDNPTYEVNGVVHYCVANMPGAVSHTSTFALTNVTTRYALDIVTKGLKKAVKEDPALAFGMNACGGAITHEAVAQGLGMEYVPLENVLPEYKGR